MLTTMPCRLEVRFLLINTLWVPVRSIWSFGAILVESLEVVGACPVSSGDPVALSDRWSICVVCTVLYEAMCCLCVESISPAEAVPFTCVKPFIYPPFISHVLTCDVMHPVPFLISRCSKCIAES
eukprot:gene3386-6717_t